MKYRKIAMLMTIFFASLIFLKAEVSLDEVIQSGRFLFYRDHADAHKYYYVPDEPRLARRSDGTPEFTFIKYTKAGGDMKGGVVHFLVTWGLTSTEIGSAESALQLFDPEGEVIGPVPFKEGTFKIISATASADGIFDAKVCGEGQAPIMPGQKGAVSIALNQEGASLLWESFKNPTTDVSVMFLLKYNGITPAYEAKLKVDWDKVYTHHDVSLTGGGVVKGVKLEGEIKAIFEELRQQGAIQLDVTGESNEMEKLLEMTYGHLIKLMCTKELKTETEVRKSKSTATTRRPTTTTRRPTRRTPTRTTTSSSRTSSSQRRTPTRTTKRTPVSTPKVSKQKPQNPIPYNIELAYTFKRVKMSGHYEVDFRHRLREERVMVISGNVRGIYDDFGEDERFFSTVSLDDPTFQDRTIEVILDGQNFEDFKNYINSVSVLFKKERWGKPTTTGEVKFFDEQFAKKGNRLSFVYGREGEGSTEWLNYEYKPKWSFHGGIEWEGDWVKTSDSVVTLSPVVIYRIIQITLDKDNIEENGIKAVAFQIKHQIYGKENLREVIIDNERGDPLEAEYRYLHEEGKLDYQYKIVWLLKDGREIHSDWITKETPIIYAYYQE
jgi:hypothetical protein